MLPLFTHVGDGAHAETVISMEPGALKTASLELQPGGRLEVKVVGSILKGERPTTADEVAVRDRYGAHWSEAFLTLLKPDGRELERVLRFDEGFPGFSGFGPRLVESWPLNRTHTSGVLPAGAYTLRASILDRPPLLVPVTITAGETTKLELAFP